MRALLLPRAGRLAAPRTALLRVARCNIALCGIAIVVSACSDRRSGDRQPLSANDAWARAADSGTTGGAYVTLTNTDSASVTIVGVASDVSSSASIHETMDMDGMSHMMARPSITIDRDSTLRMTPGGLHVMLNDLMRALRVGDSLTLHFTLSATRSPIDSSANAASTRVISVVVHVRAP